MLWGSRYRCSEIGTIGTRPPPRPPPSSSSWRRATSHSIDMIRVAQKRATGEPLRVPVVCKRDVGEFHTPATASECTVASRVARRLGMSTRPSKSKHRIPQEDRTHRGCDLQAAAPARHGTARRVRPRRVGSLRRAAPRSSDTRAQTSEAGRRERLRVPAVCKRGTGESHAPATRSGCTVTSRSESWRRRASRRLGVSTKPSESKRVRAPRGTRGPHAPRLRSASRSTSAAQRSIDRYARTGERGVAAAAAARASSRAGGA